MRRKELRHLLSGKIFVKGFITLFTMIAIVFAIFAGYVYSNSRTIMNREFLTNSERTAQNLVATVDDNLGNIKEIAASLAIDDNVNLFFNTNHPETIIPDTYSRTQSLLKGYVNGYSSIDSIYLYSERSHTILTPFEKTPVKYFSDTNWVSRFSNLKSGFVTFMRKKNDS